MTPSPPDDRPGAEPQANFRRLLPDVPLPAYRHVPGVTPHPHSHPEGHRWGQELVATPLTEDNWSGHRAYWLGLDLWNQGYPWEAHEVWESVWLAEGRQGTTGKFLKGLIQLAVAAVKIRQGLPHSMRRHALRAIELFAAVQADLPAGQRCHRGLNLDRLCETAHVLLSSQQIGFLCPGEECS